MLNRTKKLMPMLLVVVLLAVSAVPALAAPPGPTIVELALAANAEGGPFEGVFDTLIAALLAADPAVIETLGGNGQFTVFAPTDDAFADLGLDPDNIDTLPQEALTQILLYHVAPGRRYATDVIASERILTLYGRYGFARGQDAFLFQDGGVLTDNLGRDATIIVTDVEAANGIIHAIDAVVLPFDPS